MLVGKMAFSARFLGQCTFFLVSARFEKPTSALDFVDYQ
jgi:hypothetical protein